MNKNNYSNGGKFVTALLLLSMLSVPALIKAETTSVINSVSVSSDGDGSAHASVKTTINGVVVEDQSIETSGTINSQIEVSDGTTQVEGNVDYRPVTQEERLLTLIEKLKVLIQYYVSLLNKTS